MNKNTKIILVIAIIILAGLIYHFGFMNKNMDLMKMEGDKMMMGSSDKIEKGMDMDMNSMNGDRMEKGKMMMENFSAINPKMFETMMNNGEFISIDVRTPEEISEGKTKDDALEINFYDADFREQISKLDRNKKYLVNCRSGARSGKAVQIMKELGFTEVYDLAGGINAWRAQGLKENQ